MANELKSVLINGPVLADVVSPSYWLKSGNVLEEANGCVADEDESGSFWLSVESELFVFRPPVRGLCRGPSEVTAAVRVLIGATVPALDVPATGIGLFE